MTPRRVLLVAGALVLVLLAVLMPSAWYDALPRQSDLPRPPISGVTLLRTLMLVQAAVVMWVGLWGAQGGSRATGIGNRESGLGDREEPGDITEGQARWWLVALTLVALGLRLYRVNSDLWLDEISPINDYARLPVVQIVGSYLRSNNHLLNTLLLKVMIALFGEHEWSVRLPAVLFGAAGVPLVFWCGRLVLSRRGALAAALLLAVSYHDIFFSQNARGYSAYLCFALLSTRLLIDGLRDDRMRSWAWYVVATVLGFASLLNTAFVLAAQGLVALAAVWMQQRRGGNGGALLRRVLAVFGIAGFLSVELYSVALPDVYEVITHVYRTESTGFAFFSREFAQEMIRGITDGFGAGARLAAIPFLFVAGAGFVALLRRSWALAFALVLPGVMTATFLLVRGLTFSPRFFLLWLPLTAITAVVAIDEVARLVRGVESLTRLRLVMGTVGVLALLSTASLKRYYEVPKQPYRAALAYAEQHRGPDDLVIVVYLAHLGIRYYGDREQVPMSSHYRNVRTVAELDSALAGRGRGQVWLLVTFERALRMDLPELDARLRAGWVETQKFPGTIGDGGIGVWRERTPALSPLTPPTGD